jgi:hypothetical protein
MAAPVRVKPGNKTKAFNQVGGSWQDADQDFVKKAGVGAITAIVRIQGSNDDFMLTAGHVFRDVDLNQKSMLNPDDTNNITGNPANRRATNPPAPVAQPDTFWGEEKLVVQGFNPYAQSFMQYRCPGDKLGSHVDAGIAQLQAGIPFNLEYYTPNAGGGRITINAIDAWPPIAPVGQEQYEIAGWVVNPPIVWHNQFQTDWPAWNDAGDTGNGISVVDNVMLNPFDRNVQRKFPTVFTPPLLRRKSH